MSFEPRTSRPIGGVPRENFGRQYPGSATAEEPPAEPKAPSSADLCTSCLAADTCVVAVNKGLVAGAAGGAPDAIMVARCPFFIPPLGDTSDATSSE